MHAAPGERVEVRGKCRDEGLALACLHLGDPPEVQRGAAHDLDVVVALAEHPRGRLSNHGERFGEQIIEILPVREALTEQDRPRRQLRVGDVLELRSERGDFRDDRLEKLELLAFARVEDLLEQAHRA